MERSKICRCAQNTGKLIKDISDVKDQIKLIEFENVNEITAPNIKRHLELVQKRILSVSDSCNIDTIHQADTTNNIVRGTDFMTKMSDINEFKVEKSMILRNLEIIQEQIIMKLEDCSKK